MNQKEFSRTKVFGEVGLCGLKAFEIGNSWQRERESYFLVFAGQSLD